MRVLVSGHNGYIGSVLAPMLAARGHRVVGCDTDLFRRCTFGEDRVSFPNIGIDVRDLVANDLCGFDAVIHLAALANAELGEVDPALTLEINASASHHVALLAKQARVGRFVLASSCTAYAGGDALLDENSPLEPRTAYDRSKVIAEERIAGLASEEFSPVVLRCASVYGASPRLRFDSVVNNLTAWAVAEGLVPLKSDGNAWRGFIHVEDVARAFVAAVEAPREAVHLQSFNVGRIEENYRIRDVALIVSEEIDAARIRVREGAAAGGRGHRLDCEKFARTFPGTPLRWRVRDGVRELLEVYRRHGVMPADFEGPRYQRAAHLRMLMTRGLVGSDLRPFRPHATAGVRIG